MRLPEVHGVIRRRLLVNFRADPSVLVACCPRRSVPSCHDGWAVAGICLIRLEEIRPKGFPRLARTLERERRASHRGRVGRTRARRAKASTSRDATPAR